MISRVTERERDLVFYARERQTDRLRQTDRQRQT